MHPSRKRASFRCPTRGRHAQFDACQPSPHPSATSTHPRDPTGLRPPAIIVRASILPILHSRRPQPPDARSAGKCCHSPPFRTPCALSRSPRQRLYFLYFTHQPTGNARHTKGGKCCHPPAFVRATSPPAITTRASILPILHSPTPAAAGRTKGGKVLPPPALRAPCAPSRDHHASVYTSYTSLTNPLETLDTRRAGNGPSHSPPPLRVQLEPLARHRLRSA
ncbi:hypothetical protein QFZ54_002095 [Sphingomonas faeni]|nr:hypothetical protein [Sphingomonas faeni]